MEPKNKAIIFEGKEIRCVWHKEGWWYTVKDIVVAMSRTKDSKSYIKNLRRGNPKFAKKWNKVVRKLQVVTKGGLQPINCANTKNILMIIQLVPSLNARPFQEWLANYGADRFQNRKNELELKFSSFAKAQMKLEIKNRN